MSLKLKQFIICHCCFLSVCSCNKNDKNTTDDSRININDHQIDTLDPSGGDSSSNGNGFQRGNTLGYKLVENGKEKNLEQNIKETKEDFLEKIKLVSQYIGESSTLFVDSNGNIQSNYNNVIDIIGKLKEYVKNNQNTIDLEAFHKYAEHVDNIFNCLSNTYIDNGKNGKIGEKLISSIKNSAVFENVRIYTINNDGNDEYEIYNILMADKEFNDCIDTIKKNINTYQKTFLEVVTEWKKEDFCQLDSAVGVNNETILNIIKDIIKTRYTLTNLIYQANENLINEKQNAQDDQNMQKSNTSIDGNLKNAEKALSEKEKKDSQSFENFIKNRKEDDKKIIADEARLLSTETGAIDRVIEGENNISERYSDSCGGYPLYFLYEYIQQEKSYSKKDNKDNVIYQKFDNFENNYNYSEEKKTSENIAYFVDINNYEINTLKEEIKKGIQTYIENKNQSQTLSDDVRRGLESNKEMTIRLIYKYINRKINICRNLMAVYKKDKIQDDQNDNKYELLFDLSDEKFLGHQPMEDLINSVFNSKEQSGQILCNVKYLELDDNLKIVPSQEQSQNGIEAILSGFFQNLDNLTEEINKEIKDKSCHKAALAIKHFSAFWVFKGAFFNKLRQDFSDELKSCYKAIQAKRDLIQNIFKNIAAENKSGALTTADNLYARLKDYGEAVVNLGNNLIQLRNSFSKLQNCLNDYYSHRKEMQNPFLGDEEKGKYYSNHKYIVKTIDEYFQKCFVDVQEKIIEILEKAKEESNVILSQHEENFIDNNKGINFAKLYNGDKLNINKCTKSFETYLFQTFFYNYEKDFKNFVDIYSPINTRSSQKYQESAFTRQELVPCISIVLTNNKYELKEIGKEQKKDFYSLEKLIREYYNEKKVEVNGNIIFEFKGFGNNIAGDEGVLFEDCKFFANKIKDDNLANVERDDFLHDSKGLLASDREYDDIFYDNKAFDKIKKDFINAEDFYTNKGNDKHIHVQKIVIDRLGLINDIVDELWTRMKSLQNMRQYLPKDKQSQEVFTAYVTSFRKNLNRLIKYDIIRDLQNLSIVLRYEFCDYLGSYVITEDDETKKEYKTGNKQKMNPITDTISSLEALSVEYVSLLKEIVDFNKKDIGFLVVGDDINEASSYFNDEIKNCRAEYTDDKRGNDKISNVDDNRTKIYTQNLKFAVDEKNKYNGYTVDRKTSSPTLSLFTGDNKSGNDKTIDNIRTALRTIYKILNKSYERLLQPCGNTPYYTTHYITTEFLNRMRYNFLGNKANEIFNNEMTKEDGTTVKVNELNGSKLDELYAVNTNASMFKNIGMAIGYLVKIYNNYKNDKTKIQNVYKSILASSFYSKKEQEDKTFKYIKEFKPHKALIPKSKFTLEKLYNTKKSSDMPKSSSMWEPKIKTPIISALCIDNDDYFKYNHKILHKSDLHNEPTEDLKTFTKLLKYFLKDRDQDPYTELDKNLDREIPYLEIHAKQNYVNNSWWSQISPVNIFESSIFYVEHDNDGKIMKIEFKSKDGSIFDCSKAVLRFASIISNKKDQEIVDDLKKIYNDYVDTKEKVIKLSTTELKDIQPTKGSEAFNKALTECFRDLGLIDFFNTKIEQSKNETTIFEVIKDKHNEIEEYFGIVPAQKAKEVVGGGVQDSISVKFNEVGGIKKDPKQYLHKFCEFLSNYKDYVKGKEDFVMTRDYLGTKEPISLNFLEGGLNNKSKEIEIKKFSLLYNIMYKNDNNGDPIDPINNSRCLDDHGCYNIHSIPIGAVEYDNINNSGAGCATVFTNNNIEKNDKFDPLNKYSYKFIKTFLEKKVENGNKDDIYYIVGNKQIFKDQFVKDQEPSINKVFAVFGSHQPKIKRNYDCTKLYTKNQDHFNKITNIMNNWNILVKKLIALGFNDKGAKHISAKCWLFLIREIQAGNIKFENNEVSYCKNENDIKIYGKAILELIKYCSLGILSEGWDGTNKKHETLGNFDKDEPDYKKRYKEGDEEKMFKLFTDKQKVLFSKEISYYENGSKDMRRYIQKFLKQNS